MKSGLLKDFREKKLDQLELHLINKLISKEIPPDSLKVGEKIEIAAALRLRGWKSIEIANVLGIKVRQVQNYFLMIFKRRAHLVKHLSVERVAGNFLDYGDNLRADAIKKGDLSLAWDITCDMVKILQEMGLIYRAPIDFKGEVKGEFNLRSVSDDDLFAATKSLFDRGSAQN